MSDQQPDTRLEEYREELVKEVKTINLVYDRLMTAVSGGALVSLSIALLRDLAGLKDIPGIRLLFGAWVAFALSLSLIFIGLLFAESANRKAIDQVDAGTIENERPGGWFVLITDGLGYYAVPLCLLTGLALVGLFLQENI